MKLDLNTLTYLSFVETEEPKSQLKFFLSRRGKPQLLYHDFLYNSDSTSNGRTYWRCSETRRGSCLARLVTSDDTVYEKQPLHDHPPKHSRLEGKKALEFITYKAYMEKILAASRSQAK